jgi:hypothetical protein
MLAWIVLRANTDDAIYAPPAQAASASAING